MVIGLIRSVIIRVITKIGRLRGGSQSDLFYHEYDYRPNWTTNINDKNVMEEVRALHKILFCQRAHKLKEMQFLDERFERMQTFMYKLYYPQTDHGPVKQRVIQKITESGLVVKEGGLVRSQSYCRDFTT